MDSISEESLKLHKEKKGKITISNKFGAIKTAHDLSIAYTPGVAEACRQISKNKENVWKYTSRGNLIAVVSDGTAVLGLGDIGPEAAMPVMEGKCILFKEFADVDAFPICLSTKNTEEIINVVKLLEPTFGGINLEDISAPRCFEIERRLKKIMQIPIFHDDQHGTAVVVLAALINALKIVNKKIEDISIAISGTGAAGTAVAKMLLSANVGDIIICDRKGIVHKNRDNLNDAKKEIASITNKSDKKGLLEDAMKDADVFIGVSAPGIVSCEMVKSMKRDAIVFAMANPVPEIMPDLAKGAGARIIGTGRSDFENQINNVLAFPGIFRGALDAKAKQITEDMKLAAAMAIANTIAPDELNENNIIPSPLNRKVAVDVAEAVKLAAKH
ncbi:MAG: NAD-dependent malic enzyme [Candidatus Nanohalarchaeota archaeon]|nr:MAG: NAD-dependent malic enzyme [Candidatus Nanohaloarchaeota archaeon]